MNTDPEIILFAAVFASFALFAVQKTSEDR
jgi:hypothetical protein